APFDSRRTPPGCHPRYEEAGLILLILFANGIFGFFQDYRAEMSIKALRELSTPNTTVLRDGEKVTIDAEDVVPGISSSSSRAMPSPRTLDSWR
ncbi:hypothetical protein, partial [Haladaptatus sp. W1]|uniref:hypothetical protein n=1 Tax=Haladaptatus sp. W1 TaxID=1897478 RepID=UPI0020C74B88